MEMHDQLLAALPGIYERVYLEPELQRNRPEVMSFWDFVVGDIHGVRVSELVKAKAAGKKVVGTFCLYVPDELIEAAGAVGVGLCGGTNFSEYAARDVVPANTCPLIKSAMGFALGSICPYYASVDLLVGETTCDGKKKAWEVLSATKRVHVLETPQCKGRPQARALYLAELRQLASVLEDLTGNQITPESLHAACEKVQLKRDQLARVHGARKADPVPISGKDALLVSQVAFYDDLDREVEMLGKLADELERRVESGVGVAPAGTKRIVVSGTPHAIPNWKLHDVVETSGAVVVAEETCTGTRYFQSRLEVPRFEPGRASVDELLEKIADRYLSINCACFTPNDGRAEDVERLAREYRADGVILNSLSFCTPYEQENLLLERRLRDAGVKVLSVSTDYSDEDVAQLKTRVEAFLEML